MKKQINLLLSLATVGIFAVTGLAVSQQNAQAKSATVKIGTHSVPRDYLNTDTYYKTTKKVSVNAHWFASNKEFSTKLTVPKGTVITGKTQMIQVGKKWKSGLLLNQKNNLRYKYIKSGIDKGYSLAQINTTNKAAFSKVKTPTFVPTYSHGNLTIGGTSAIGSSSSKSVQFTSDGYVEVHTNTNKSYNALAYYRTPSASVKITKTSVKGSYRYIYTKTKIKGLTTKHVKTTGNYRYRLTLKNQHKPVFLAGDPDNDLQAAYYSLYSLGGKTYFTQIAQEAE